MFKIIRQYIKATDKLYLCLCVCCSVLSVVTLVSLGMENGGFAVDAFDGSVTGLGAYRNAFVQAAASLLVTALVWAITCGIGLAAFGSSLAGVPPAAVALALGGALVFALVPLTIGFLLGQLGASEMVANAVGNIAGMVMSFLGGAWISIELMGPEIQTLSRFIPTSWYTEAVSKSVHLTDVTLSSAAPVLANLGVVALFAAALFAVALVAGRVRMRSAEAGGNAAASMTGA